MKILDFFKRLGDAFSRRENEMNEEALSAELVRAVLGSSTVNRENALKLPAVSGYVDLISGLFAMVPFKLYKKVKDEKGRVIVEEIIDDRRTALLNTDTHSSMDAFQVKKALCEDYLLGRGGYAYINRLGNEVYSLHYVKDTYISIYSNYDPIFFDYYIGVDGNFFEPWDFLKLLRNSKDGATGEGVVKEIDVALRAAIERLWYDLELAKTGGSRKGFLTSKKHLTEEAMTKIKEAWAQYYSGNNSTVVLNDGMEFKEAANTSRENESNEKERTFLDNIKIIFHIGKNYDETIKQALVPIAAAFEAALNKDYLLEEEKESFYFAADLSELYKGDLKERYEAYKIAIESGFKTRNEIRHIENDNYIDGLDTVNLGLGDVLLNAESGQVYVPNTGKTFAFGAEGSENSAELPDDNVFNG